MAISTASACHPTLCRTVFFTEANAPFAARALITDGRSLTQRLKIQALGLTDLFDDILISEAMQSEKPDDKRFVFLQNKYPAAKRFIYIGDNIKKILSHPTNWVGSP